jgi:2-amino-4-hydroxy-6-hydroxymethyldihydropteridine diphosphokinase
MNRITTAYVGLGSNIGDRRRHLENAIRSLDQTPGIKVSRVARLYETDPIGPRQRSFYNSAVEVQSQLSPSDLMKTLLHIENSLGRVRQQKWGPRSIDLDLLIYGARKVQERNLTIPHPHMAHRRFVMAPLCDLAPRHTHPVLKRQNRTLLRQLTPLGQRVTMVGLWKETRFYPSKKRKS